MADAKLIWRRVCKNLDDRNWKYDTDEDNLAVILNVTGEDIPMNFVIRADEKRDLLKMVSFLPFKMDENKRAESAAAVCAINSQLANGNFDLDLFDGTVTFRLAVTFAGGMPDEAINYLIGVSCLTVDEYNDKLLMLNKGMLDLEKFIESV